MAEQLTLNQLVGSSSLPRLTSNPNTKEASGSLWRPLDFRPYPTPTPQPYPASATRRRRMTEHPRNHGELLIVLELQGRECVPQVVEPLPGRPARSGAAWNSVAALHAAGVVETRKSTRRSAPLAPG